jgi:fluoride ion exporter CrcB/FEX
LVMGFLSEDFELFRVDVDKPVALPRTGEDQEQKEWRARYTKQKKAIPLYIGLTTGFCGCLTSFSSLMRDVFFAISNDLPVPIAQDTGVSLYRGPPPVYEAPNGGYSFMAVIAVIFAEVGLSLIALFVGAHVAIFAAKGMPTISSTFMKKFLDPLVLVLAPLVWVAIICLAALLPYPPPGIDTWSAMTWRGPSLFALAFAPLGCLTRFYLSIKFNRRFISFPFGTFLANAIGTMILGMAFALQHAPLSPAGSGLIGGSFAGCQVLQGVMDGFCGCLTTVSTWVLELSDSKREHAYIYGSVTVVVSLAALVLEMGSLRWTRGFESPTCFT